MDLEKLTRQVELDLEGQNWTDHPLTEPEKTIAWMAVRSTLAHLPFVHFNPPQWLADLPISTLIFFWRWLPDRCQMEGCERRGLRGNENIIGGKRVCDNCHAKMMRAPA